MFYLPLCPQHFAGTSHWIDDGWLSVWMHRYSWMESWWLDRRGCLRWEHQLSRCVSQGEWSLAGSHGLDSHKSLQTWLCFPGTPRSEAQPVFSRASTGGVGCICQTSQCGPGWGEKKQRRKAQRRSVVLLLELWIQLECQLCVDLVGTCPQLKT